MQPMDPDSEGLKTAVEAFIIPLRYREGFDTVALGRLQDAINTIAHQWVESDTVPKIIAWQLCSLSVHVWQMADNYEGAERERIQRASASITHMVDQCFLPRVDERIAFDRD